MLLIVSEVPRSGGISVGLKKNKGFPVTKRALRPRPAANKGKTGKRSQFVREVIRDVAGYAPYEKRIMELLRNGLDKRALRLSKRKLGTHGRGKRKKEELSGVLRRANKN